MMENVRSFAGRHEIDFGDEKVVVFLGVNGAGKSTVLESLAFCVEQIASSLGKLKMKTVLFQGRHIVTNGFSEGAGAIMFSFDAHSLVAEANFHLELGKKPSGVIAMGGAMDEFLKTAIFDKSKSIPVISYYQTQQSVSQTKIAFDTLLKDYGRAQTYHNAINPGINFSRLIQWFTNQVNLQNSEAIRRRNIDFVDPSIDAIKKGLSAFVSALEEGDENAPQVVLEVQDDLQVFYYVKGEQRLNFSQLSTGEKIVVGLAMDIAYRCVTANPQLENPLESEGVILIDEIELHLHPRWQANIIKALTATFPNLQFIITTHSPLVVNQLKNEQLFLLTKDGIIPGRKMDETYGMDANTVIANVMGAPYRPPSVSEKFRKIEKLLDDPDSKNLKAARKALDELTKIISPNDAELLGLDTLLKLEQSAVDI
jgi:predicted ATP-binding protein involved in virulence